MLFAFSLTLIAGLATGIGGAIAFFTKRTDKTTLSVALGFSAGVMIYISLVEILGRSGESLAAVFGQRAGEWINIVSFFAGIGIMALIDALVPSEENPHELHTVEEMADKHPVKDKRLLRTGLFMALAIAIHNLPEGLATFMAGVADPKLGISVALAIAIHNIPEGIAVSVPIFYATGSRKAAFAGSFLSGLAEPVGALIGIALFSVFLPEHLFGIVFAAVAGIMIYISFDELLPAAREYGKHHHAIGGLIAGMALMAVSLAIL
jgi:zinc transporter, ZIP family